MAGMAGGPLGHAFTDAGGRDASLRGRLCRLRCAARAAGPRHGRQL